MAKENEYAKQKAELMEKITERTSKWLDRVMQESIRLDDGEFADIKFSIGKDGYGPPPDEDQLFSLSVEETINETGL